MNDPSDDPASSRRPEAEESLRQCDDRYQRLGDLLPDGLILETEGRISFINPAGARLLGSLPPEEIVGRPLARLFPSEQAETVDRRLRKMHERGGPLVFSEIKVLRWDGTLVDVEWGAIPVTYLGKSSSQIVLRDLTLYARVEELLKNSEALYHSLVETLPQNVFRKDLEGRFTFANERFCQILGRSLKDVLGKTDHDFYPLELALKYAKDDARLLKEGGVIDTIEEHHPPGKARSFVHVIKTPIFDADRRVIGIQGIFRDVTAQKRQEEEIARLAYYDALTGLPNRSLFLDRLAQTIKRTKRRKNKNFAVMFLDLDHFKHVNDSLGHGSGDQLLQGFARRVEKLVRPGDTLARLGGDEFTILLEEIRSSEDIARVAERILQALKAPFSIRGQDVFTSVSIGMAIGESHEKPEDLLRDADTALYRAKERGRARYEAFDPAMHARAVERLKTETELRRALDRGEFRVHYQPIASVSDERIIGLEALLRWEHPDRGLLLPGQFLPVAEESGLILPIDLWVLRTACGQMKRWHEGLPKTVRPQIHVNISSRHFAQTRMAAEVQAILQDTGLDPRYLTLEITESVLLEEFSEAVQSLASLKDLHIQLYLDDFGSGTFSFKGLRRPPIDSLKIHHSFVKDLEKGTREEEVVRTITALAGNLKMGVIAEGVETPEQLKQLRALDCAQIQGFLISKPVSAELAQSFLTGKPNPPRR
jgi:diguanylate cyclase (GGDEF)-like protein/PAS domain S-box-containing protein